MKKLFLLSLIILANKTLVAQTEIEMNNEMKELLRNISIKAIELTNPFFSEEQINSNWIGYSPASQTAIDSLEKRLGIALPVDFREFLSITNGFNDPNGVEPSFCNISQIDYLKNTDPQLLEIWSFPSDPVFTEKFKSAIQVGGFGEEQQFYLIPPGKYNANWEYWHFAAWSPGEAVFHSLMEYLNSALETTVMFLNDK